MSRVAITERSIDLTPSMPVLFRMLIEIMKHGTEEARKEAEEELMRVAQKIDEVLES